MTRSVAIELRFLIETVQRAEETVVGAAAQSLARPLTLEVLIPVQELPDQDMRTALDLSGRAIIRTLRAELPEVLVVDVTASRLVTIWVETRHGPMQVTFDRRRVSASNPHQLLVLMVVLGVLMTLVSYVFLRNQLRPIKRLAAAAADYGKGRVMNYHPSGANEVRAAGNAFLDMRNRIERQTQQRTLMLSGVSHDLRTPLTRFKLGLSLIDDPQVEMMRRDVDEMQGMLDGFLNFSSSESTGARETVNPLALVKDCVAAAQRGGQNVNWIGQNRADVDQDHSVEVALNTGAVRRAIGNLIENAVRYGGQADVSVVVSDRAVVIAVEDAGAGIAPEDRENALKPFTRLDLARNQDAGAGVGLGLAITSDIARSHGGMLRLGKSERLGGLKADLVLAR
jgi:two-component system osmolarity sensor histidine kinase EnvZ